MACVLKTNYLDIIAMGKKFAEYAKFDLSQVNKEVLKDVTPVIEFRETREYGEIIDSY